MERLKAICTIFTKSRLSYTRVLTQSFLDQHPEGQVFACLVDEIEGCYDPTSESFITVLAKNLSIPQWDHLSFKYTPMSLTTAIKPFLIAYLLETQELDCLAYFDCDIAIYSSLKELEVLLTATIT